MDSKKLIKTIAKFAAIIAGVFILAQAVSANIEYEASVSYSNGSCSYCSFSYESYDGEPSYSYKAEYYDSYDYGTYYYDNYSYETSYPSYYDSYNYGTDYYYENYPNYNYANYPSYYSSTDYGTGNGSYNYGSNYGGYAGGTQYNTAPVVSYDRDFREYPPLYDWGTYHADAIGGYAYSGYYSTYSPYVQTYAYSHYPMAYAYYYTPNVIYW